MSQPQTSVFFLLYRVFFTRKSCILHSLQSTSVWCLFNVKNKNCPWRRPGVLPRRHRNPQYGTIIITSLNFLITLLTRKKDRPKSGVYNVGLRCCGCSRDRCLDGAVIAYIYLKHPSSPHPQPVQHVLMQERQLQEAAKNNEQAQAVINQLKTSLQQLEVRFKQVSICDQLLGLGISEIVSFFFRLIRVCQSFIIA